MNEILKKIFVELGVKKAYGIVEFENEILGPIEYNVGLKDKAGFAKMLTTFTEIDIVDQTRKAMRHVKVDQTDSVHAP